MSFLDDLIPEAKTITPEIYAEGIETTKNIAQSWDTVWQKVILFFNAETGTVNVDGYNLYSTLSRVGFVFASGMLVFYAVWQFKQLQSGNHQEYFLSLIAPLLIALLLSNGGVRLAGITYELRNFINQINTQILESAAEGTNLEEAYQNFQREIAFRYIAPSLNAQCEQLTGKDLTDCLATAVAQANTLDPNEREASPVSTQSSAWAVLGNVGQILTAPNPLFTALQPLFASSGEVAAFLILNSFQSGFQQLLEGSLLLTALLGPIAVGGSLLPISGTYSVVAWLTGFFAIAFAKISFNIIAGLAAVASVSAGATDPLPLATILGVFAPILSTALAAGGGLAVWQGMSGAAEGAVGLAGRVIQNFF